MRRKYLLCYQAYGCSGFSNHVIECLPSALHKELGRYINTHGWTIISVFEFPQ